MVRLDGPPGQGYPFQPPGRRHRNVRGREERNHQHDQHQMQRGQYSQIQGQMQNQYLNQNQIQQHYNQQGQHGPPAPFFSSHESNGFSGYPVFPGHRSFGYTGPPALRSANSRPPPGGFRVPGPPPAERGSGGSRRYGAPSRARQQYTIDMDTIEPDHSGVYMRQRQAASQMPPPMFDYQAVARHVAPSSSLVVETEPEPATGTIKQQLEIDSEDEGVAVPPTEPPKQKKTVSDYIPELPVFPLPPLPRILDKDLEKKCFTHESLHLMQESAKQALRQDAPRVRVRSTRKHIFEAEIEKPITHNEALEHVGDRTLGFLIADWVHEVRPRLSHGTATKLESNLVSNATLCHLSVQYSLPERLSGVPDRQTETRLNAKVRANLFEAYIAAVYYSYPRARRGEAMAVLDAWLREVYAPLADYFLTEQRALSRFVDGIVLHGQYGVDVSEFDAAANGKQKAVEELCRKQGYKTTMAVIKVAYAYQFQPGDDHARIEYFLDKTPDMFQATFEATGVDGKTVAATECRFKKQPAETAAVYRVGLQLGFAGSHA